MNTYFKRCQPRPEHTMVSLFIFLFFISFIESFRLLAITAASVILYSLITTGTKVFFKMVKASLPFVALLVLPTIIRYILSGTLADLDFTIMIISKILISAVLLGTIVSKHSALYLVDGVLNIGLPQIINKILALTFRYFYMITADVQIGKKALTSRGINERKGLSSLSVFGDWIGGFFLKSTQHSDMVFNAMKSRGFEGTSRNETFKNKKLIVESCMLILVFAAVLIIDGMV